MPYTIDDVQRTLQAAAQALCAMEAELTAIDSKLGDGDMGQSMANGAGRYRPAWRNRRTKAFRNALTDARAPSTGPRHRRWERS